MIQLKTISDRKVSINPSEVAAIEECQNLRKSNPGQYIDMTYLHMKNGDVFKIASTYHVVYQSIKLAQKKFKNG